MASSFYFLYDILYTTYDILTKKGGGSLNKNSLAIAKMAAAAAEDKKAKDTVILKLSKLTLIADYF
ncbi:unnamed protein product, partial [marine sediment metagenome]